jgi:hypothetical protein
MAAAPAAKSAKGNAHGVALFSIGARRSGLVQHGVSRPARRRSDCPSPIQHPGCRETLIVKQNHGFLNVYSEPGHGTTFKLYLPRHGGAAKQAAESTTTKDTGGHEVILNGRKTNKLRTKNLPAEFRTFFGQDVRRTWPGRYPPSEKAERETDSNHDATGFRETALPRAKRG